MLIETTIAHGSRVLIGNVRGGTVEGRPAFSLDVVRLSGDSLSENMTDEQASDLLAALLSMGVMLNDSAKRSLRLAGDDPCDLAAEITRRA